MSTRKKRESVSASFHYLVRMKRKENGDEIPVKFTEDEFDHLVKEIKEQPKFNLNNNETLDRLKARIDIPLEKMTLINKRTVFGIFRAPYTGHSYENSARGKIPADSVSLRPFHYLLYLSDSGKIYLCAQYLGQFGGYGSISKKIIDLLPQPSSIRSRTFRVDATHYKNAKAKRVNVSFSQKPQSITSNNIFSSGGMIAFEKQNKDDGFEEAVSERLLSLVGAKHGEIKKKVATLLSKHEAIDVDDEDIRDCTILADINGKKKMIYLLQAGNFATKFPLDVPLTSDGHPDYGKLKTAMLNLLKDEIIARKENV